MRKSFLYLLTLAFIPLFFACTPQLAESKDDFKEEIRAIDNKKILGLEQKRDKQIRELELEARVKKLEERLAMLENSEVSATEVYSRDGKYINFLPELEAESKPPNPKLPKRVYLDTLKKNYLKVLPKLRLLRGPKCPRSKCPYQEVGRVVGVGFENELENMIIKIANTDKIISSGYQIQRFGWSPDHYLSTVKIETSALKGTNYKVDIEYVRGKDSFTRKGVTVSGL